MLAQNFKTADALGIPEDWRDALIKTLALIDGGKLTHVAPADSTRFWRTEPTFTGHFNMGEWSAVHSCGTVCCLGGTAELIGGISIDEGRTPELYRLFYPNPEIELNFTYSSITLEQAAIALRSYLTTGDARWDLALAE